MLARARVVSTSISLTAITAALVLAAGIAPVSAAKATVASATIVPRSATVYPVKDGYLDSQVLTIDVEPVSAATTGASAPLHKVAETVKVTHSGKTIKTWKLSAWGVSHIAWNARVHGKVVTGKFTAKVTAVSGSGAPVKASKSFLVSKKKLVTTSKTVSETAKLFFSTFDPSPYCTQLGTSLACTSSGTDAESSASGQMLIPAGLFRYAAQSKTKALVKLTVTKVARNGGGAAWSWGDNMSGSLSPDSGITKTGALAASGKLAIDSHAQTIIAQFEVLNSASVQVSRISITFYYAVLR